MFWITSYIDDIEKYLCWDAKHAHNIYHIRRREIKRECVVDYLYIM